MTNKETILQEFRKNGNQITLGYALQHPWGYKMASRCADLRKEGYKIDCIKGHHPSENLYVLTEQDTTGQFRFI